MSGEQRLPPPSTPAAPLLSSPPSPRLEDQTHPRRPPTSRSVFNNCPFYDKPTTQTLLPTSVVSYKTETSQLVLTGSTKGGPGFTTLHQPNPQTRQRTQTGGMSLSCMSKQKVSHDKSDVHLCNYTAILLLHGVSNLWERGDANGKPPPGHSINAPNQLHGPSQYHLQCLKRWN